VRLEHGAGQHQAGFEISPQRHQELARKRRDDDAPYAPFAVADALTKPGCSRRCRADSALTHVVLRFDLRDHLQRQLQMPQFADDSGLQPRRQGAPVARAQAFRPRLSVGSQGS
jgi:hypothetical protein